MPESAQSHRDRSREFADKADVCEASFDPGWSIVLRFYAALHLTQAYLSTKNQRFDAKEHQGRRQAIRNSPELMKGGQFLPTYDSLKNLSESVRYTATFVATDADVRLSRTYLSSVVSFLGARVERALANNPTP